jgi:hypothetical protein
MPLVMLVVVILLPLGLALLSMGERSRAMAMSASSAIAARAAADAGLTKAVCEMNGAVRSGTFSPGNLPTATDEGLPGTETTCSYAVTWDSQAGYEARCTGKCRDIERMVHCTLRLRGPCDFSLFTRGPMSLKTGTIVDWYNYEGQSIGNQVGTNSNEPESVALYSGAVIRGDMVTGPGEDPDVVIKNNGATITGGTYAQLEETVMLPVTVPAFMQALPSSGILKDGGQISGTRKYSGIDLKNGKKIVIQGPTTLYVTGDVLFGNSAGIEIQDEGASLTLYLGGGLVGANASGFNNLSEDAHRLTIYGLDSCRSLAFKNSSDFYGVLYAPQANAVIDNSGDLYGSFVAGSFEAKNSARIMYDASLRNVTPDDQAVYFIVDRWYED